MQGIQTGFSHRITSAILADCRTYIQKSLPCAPVHERDKCGAQFVTKLFPLCPTPLPHLPCLPQACLSQQGKGSQACARLAAPEQPATRLPHGCPIQLRHGLQEICLGTRRQDNELGVINMQDHLSRGDNVQQQLQASTFLCDIHLQHLTCLKEQNDFWLEGRLQEQHAKPSELF